MNIIEEALKKTTDTKACIIGIGAMTRTPEMFRELFGEAVAVIISDKNTYAAAGNLVEKALKEGGISTLSPFIFDDPDLYAEWSYIEQLEDFLKGTDAIAVAVGSGVINDLTKLVSSHLNRKYMVVGTAASMDGYTAFGASITYSGNKQTFSCKAPAGIILDPEVAAKAPKGLSASGYADLLAKIPAGADWIIADAIGSEKLDDFSFNLVQCQLRESLSAPEAVANGGVKETELLSIGLLMSGFAMQAHQSSRPASGLEHQFSHYWDMDGLCYNGKHVSHGFKVGIGTIVSTKCLEFLLNYDISHIDIEKCVASWPTWEERKALIEKIFADKPSHKERALAESYAKYVDAETLRKQLVSVIANWDSLMEKIRKQIYSSEEVTEMLRLAGAPYKSEMIGVSQEKLIETFNGIPYMRSRYSNIDLILSLGLFEEVKSYIFG